MIEKRSSVPIEDRIDFNRRVIGHIRRRNGHGESSSWKKGRTCWSLSIKPNEEAGITFLYERFPASAFHGVAGTSRWMAWIVVSFSGEEIERLIKEKGGKYAAMDFLSQERTFRRVG